ncbi:phosphate ABC transporter substrate-binding protein PstS [Candidatus Nitrosocosmicus sp. FF01]|jgi:phosphate transport system permease protein/phosphate transport system substrate-binding protein|uniref:phosphate ABC transporter substrate-binding protein PstS n=1 Tax=Candidatus Nitrosocosmicus sp. FF01 TaxID=3397670 RepID=UPI0039E85783
MVNLRNYRILGVSLLALSLLVPVYVNSVNAQQVTINGAGATFPFPLIDTWRVEYQKVNPDVSLNYASIGSGGGIKQFTEKTVDFGATDAPLSSTEFQKAGNAVHIPETIGSVVISYNLPEVTTPLKLTGPVIADIFLGKITKWDDPKIKELNPDVTLPAEDIISAHRSDGSGTTFVFTDYLSKVSPEWNSTIGVGKSVQWPSGLGAPGNEGVAASIQGSPYSIGYVELAYALTTGMKFASIQNQEGNFIAPSINSTMAAVNAAAPTLPEGSQPWNTVSITNAPGADSYPLSSFSYLLLYKELSTNPSINEQKANALVEFVEWAITDGQQFAEPLGYVPLPQSVIDINEQTLKSLTFNGNPVLTN